MFIVTFYLTRRGVEVAEFCPEFEDVRLPKYGSHWDSDGMPQYILIRWRRFKGSRRGQTDAVWFMLWRNRVHASLCPVCAIIFWMTMMYRAGVRSGAIFRALSKHGQGVDRSADPGLSHDNTEP